MSESGQGDGGRSRWEHPDTGRDTQHGPDAPTTAVPVERAGHVETAGSVDRDDPYRQAPAQSVPPHVDGGGQGWAGQGRAGQGWDDQGRAGQDATGPGAWGPPREQDRPAPWGGPSPADGYPPLTGQPAHAPRGATPYGPSPYGAAPDHGRPLHNQTYGDPSGYRAQPPVAGAAHAVCWTAVGGLLLLFSGLGWIAAVVALALTPGARRTILESGGTRSGLGYLLAGKVVAWTTIGLTVLGVVLLAVLLGGIGLLGSSSYLDSGYVGDGLTTSFHG